MAIDQDTLLRTLLSERTKVLALEKRDTIVDEQHLAAWPRTAARLRAMNVPRKKENRQRTPDDTALDRLEGHWQRRDADAGPATAEALGHCMDGLTKKAKRLVKARYGEGLAVAEVAERSGRPVASVYVTLSRVHATLADCLFRRTARSRGRS